MKVLMDVAAGKHDLVVDAQQEHLSTVVYTAWMKNVLLAFPKLSSTFMMQ